MNAKLLSTAKILIGGKSYKIKCGFQPVQLEINPSLLWDLQNIDDKFKFVFHHQGLGCSSDFDNSIVFKGNILSLYSSGEEYSDGYQTGGCAFRQKVISHLNLDLGKLEGCLQYWHYEDDKLVEERNGAYVLSGLDSLQRLAANRQDMQKSLELLKKSIDRLEKILENIVKYRQMSVGNPGRTALLRLIAVLERYHGALSAQWDDFSNALEKVLRR